MDLMLYKIRQLHNTLYNFYIFNFSNYIILSFSTILELLRESLIHESGSRPNTHNYKSRAVLSLLLNVVETIILRRIIYKRDKPFLGRNRFLPKKSTVSELSELSQRVSIVLDAQYQIYVIYTDFA